MTIITFLGTAGDMETLATQRRASGGIIIEATDQFHLDPGPGAIARAAIAGFSPRNTIGVIITNHSLLRSHDLNATIAAMTLEGMDHNGVVLGTESAINQRMDPQYKEHVEGFAILQQGARVGINQLTVMPVFEHGGKLALLLHTPEGTVGYTGDLPYSAKLAEALKETDILIINCPHPANVTEDGMMNVEGAQRLLELAKPKHAIITGFGIKIQDPKEVSRELQRLTKVRCSAAVDGSQFKL